MKSRHVYDKLSAYLDGELRRPGRVERHLASCPECAGRLRQLRAQSERLGKLSAPEITRDFAARVLEAVEHEPPPAAAGRGQVAWAGAAALVMLAGALVLYRAVLPDALEHANTPAGSGYPAEEAVIAAFQDVLEADGAPEDWMLADEPMGIAPLIPVDEPVEAEEFVELLALAVEPGLDAAPLDGDAWGALADLAPEETEILSELLEEYVHTLENGVES